MKTKDKHWSRVEYLHENVKNPNIHIKGKHSYYSDAWTGSFEETVVRYLYGDEFSLKNWQPQWEIDQLFIGDYVCIAAEVIIMLGEIIITAWTGFAYILSQITMFRHTREKVTQ